MAGRHANKFKITNRLGASGLIDSLHFTTSVLVFIADFSRRTNMLRGVEVFNDMVPESPDNTEIPMDGFTIHNEGRLPFNVGVFDDPSFKDSNNKTIKHTECVFFPEMGNDNCWIVCLEIKDCDPNNVSNYNAEIREKFINTRLELIRRGVSRSDNQYYGIASFPKVRLDFDDTIFNDQIEQLAFLKQNKIIIFASNSVRINENGVVRVF